MDILGALWARSTRIMEMQNKGDSTNSSKAFSCFLKQAPFYVVFPATISLGCLYLSKSSNLQDLLLVKLSKEMYDNFVSSFRLVFFWFHHVQVKVLQHDLFTNDVLYTEIVFDMSSLKQELLSIIPLFCQSLLEMGTKDLDFGQLNQLIGRKTGGILYSLSPHRKEGLKLLLVILLFEANPCQHALKIFSTLYVNCILQDVQFAYHKRFKQFVSQSKARMENRLRGSGHGVAAARMDVKLNSAGWISEQMGGVSYLEYLKDLEEKVEQDWNGISCVLVRSIVKINGASCVNKKNTVVALASYENGASCVNRKCY
uniref:Peptidase M16C associated domain-containing protein n=1 Tax=Lactuca sativa TaxID=4236 RepID=A0A9R1WCN8_LACSA|nr:hypothetical protein LSAT_V11C100006130 [Lactuca sativa]